MYKTTSMTTGYSTPSFGSVKQAREKYNPNLGMTLLRAVTTNENSQAKDKVFFSVGPISQERGMRSTDPSDQSIYYRNPINKKTSLYSSVILSGIGLMGAAAAYRSASEQKWTTAVTYGAASLVGFAMLPDWELRV